MRKDSATKQLGLGGSRFSAMKGVIPPTWWLAKRIFTQREKGGGC